jgi:hypothetical protein
VRRTRPVRLSLESLEDRLVPAAFIVNDVTDNNAGGGGGAGNGAGNKGDLRWCVDQARQSTDATSTITFDAATTNGKPITLQAYIRLPTMKTLTITGNGSNQTTIQYAAGVAANTIFLVDPGATDTLDSMTLSGGGGNGGLGGAIGSQGNLTVKNSVLSGNTAEEGGAIYNAAKGTLTAR